MRSEQEILDVILKVANEDERIRAVYMSGSRANPNVKKDIYQDYDIGYVVTETKSFLDDKSWINIFGDIAIVEEPDLVDLAFGIKHDFNRSYTWLMLFKDGNRIDLGIEIKDKMLEEYTSEKLTIPLLDKDNCLPKIPPPTDEDYWVKKPTEEEYTSCCTEFWWCLNNVAKGIARDELPYAMWMFNVVVRDMLVKMIEWYIGINTDFSVSAGKKGKYFKKYLPNKLYEMYSKTYSDGDYNNLWAAVFKACELFRITAIDVSEQLRYNYNQSEDINMRDYLIKVKNNHLKEKSMDYNIIAKEILSLYPISEPEIQFIRHNENITLKIIDQVCNKHYLLRIHKPATEGLFGLQHTLEGIKSEIKILQELKHKNLLKCQIPITNNLGEYITEYKLDNFNHPCYATVLEWIEGSTLTLKEDNIKEIAFKLGQNLALFHKCLKEFKPSEDFIRPIYDVDRIDFAIDELKYCVEVNLFSMEHYDIIKKVLILVKNQINELNLRKNAFGIIHADIQLGNVVINNDNPCIIDLGFCGFGYYVFDLGSAATIFPSNLRQTFLSGYSSKYSFSFDDLKYVEGQIFMDTFISYVMFMKDNQRNSWIKTSALKICDTICKDFLEGKEVFYSI